MKTTPWFMAGKQNPVRVGAYETYGGMFKYWDGKRWGYFSETPKKATEDLEGEGGQWASQVAFLWRGLLKESK